MPLSLPADLLATLTIRSDQSGRLEEIWVNELTADQRQQFWAPLLQRTFARGNVACAKVLMANRPEGVALPPTLARTALQRFEKHQAAALAGKNEGRGLRQSRDAFAETVALVVSMAKDSELAAHRWPPNLLDVAFREGAYDIFEQWRRVEPEKIERGHLFRRLVKAALADPFLVDWSQYGVKACLQGVMPAPGPRLEHLANWITDRSVGYRQRQSRQWRAQVTSGNGLEASDVRELQAFQESLFKKWMALHSLGLIRNTALLEAASHALLQKALEEGPRSSSWIVLSKYGYALPKESLASFFTEERCRQWGQVEGAYLATYALDRVAVSEAFGRLHLTGVPKRLAHQEGWDGSRMAAWAQGFAHGWADKDIPTDWGSLDAEGFLATLKAALSHNRLDGSLSVVAAPSARPRM